MRLWSSLVCRAMAALVLPLALMAAYALWLRIDEYGLTPMRLLSVAVAVLYGVGHLWAAIRSDLEGGFWRTNIVVAGVMLAVAPGAPGNRPTLSFPASTGPGLVDIARAGTCVTDWFDLPSDV